MDQVIYAKILKAVERNRVALKNVPDEFLTEELCLAAIKNNGLELRFVPDEIITPNLCSFAFRQTEIAFHCIPKEFLGNGKILLNDKGLRKKYTREELLTSSNAYLRKLGASDA